MEHQDSNSREDMKPKYCDQCGHSLVPLKTVHVARKCEKEGCEKTIYVRESSEDGKGIKVKKGDRFIIPKGFIELSLKPSGRGRLFRPGLSFLIEKLVFGDRPDSGTKLVPLLEQYEKQADKLLKNSALLEGLDIDSEDDAEEVLKRLTTSKSKPEWWAFLMGGFADRTRKAIDRNEALEAAWAVYYVINSHAMLVFSQEFEETLWRGYLANQVIYDVAAAAASTPVEAEAIKTLEPLFSKLDEGVLHTWVESGLPIAPRIGITELPEETLLALAKFHLSLRQRQREEEQKLQEDSRAKREIWLKGISVGAGAVTAIVTLLKALGIL